MDPRSTSTSGLLPSSLSNKSHSSLTPPKHLSFIPDSHFKLIELLAKVKSLEQQLSSKEIQSAQMREHYMQEIGRLSSEIAHLEVKLKAAESKLSSDNTTMYFVRPAPPVSASPEPCSKCADRERNYARTLERAALNEKTAAERIAKLEEELLQANNQLMSHKSQLNSLGAGMTACFIFGWRIFSKLLKFLVLFVSSCKF